MFVKRDGGGSLISVTSSDFVASQEGYVEEISDTDPQLLAFLKPSFLHPSEYDTLLTGLQTAADDSKTTPAVAQCLLDLKAWLMLRQ